MPIVFNAGGKDDGAIDKMVVLGMELFCFIVHSRHMEIYCMYVSWANKLLYIRIYLPLRLW